MHRVTYVSRIPPKYQALPVNSQATMASEPDNLDQNTIFIELVEARLKGVIKPTPAEIATAVRYGRPKIHQVLF